MEIESIISASITIFSLGLLLISLVGYKRNKNQKLLLLSGIFILFLIKGIVFSLYVFHIETPFSLIITQKYLGLFDLVILSILFLTTLKR